MSAEERSAMMSEQQNFLTSLLEASLAGDTSKVIGLIRQYSDEQEIQPHEVIVNFKDGSKRTALHFACLSQPKISKEVKKDDDIVEVLLSKSKFPASIVQSLISLQDENGLTPLMLSCQKFHARSYHRIKKIVDLGGEEVIIAQSKVGGTALHYVASVGASKDVITLLANKGKAAINLLSQRSGAPLHWASGVKEDYSETLETLLECGADVNATNQGGITPLILAAATGNDAHCRVLVKHGADRGLILSGNITVFHIAADMNQLVTLKALIGKDTDTPEAEDTISAKCLKMKNDKGETPLDLAVQGGHLKCVMLLSNESDEEKAKAFMEKAQSEWKTIKLNEKGHCNDSTQEAGSQDPSDEESAKHSAERILATAGSVSEAAKVDGASFKAEGNAHFAKKEWEKAIAAYTNAIQSNPADATFYSNRSAAYMGAEKFDNALYDAEMTRHIKPEWAKGFYRMAMARLALERFEDAAVSAFEGIQIDEENDELKSLLQKCIKKGRKQHLEKKKEGDNDDGKENVMALVT